LYGQRPDTSTPTTSSWPDGGFHVGRIWQALRETGHDKDTLIVFAGDNGLALGRHGLMGKQNLYDHSLRVPLIVAGPGVPQGKSDALCYLLDVFPTLCDLTGTATPATVEGKSLKPILDGKAVKVRDHLFGAYRDVQRMIDDGRWKLIRYPKADRTQLFDLAADPDEVNDLSADPKQAAKVKELLALLAAEQKRLGDPAAREGQPRHERLPKEEPRGRREKVSLGTLFLPEGLDAGRPVPLFVHFHGPAWLPEVAACRSRAAALSVNLGQGSAAYARPFAARGAFLDLLKEAENKAGVKFGEVGLTAWSAGYGAARAVLRDQAAYERVAFVVLIDGMHAGYTNDKEKGVLPEHVEAFVRFAADAAAGKKRMVVTHSEIVPGGYASTTETADHLLGRLGLERTWAAREGPMKLRQLSEARKGRLTLVGYAGDTAADHIDQFHALPDILRWIRQAPRRRPLTCRPLIRSRRRGTASPGAPASAPHAIVPTGNFTSTSRLPRRFLAQRRKSGSNNVTARTPDGAEDLLDGARPGCSSGGRGDRRAAPGRCAERVGGALLPEMP
jgi:hypothetical protein